MIGIRGLLAAGTAVLAGALVTTNGSFPFTGGPINDINVDGGVTAKRLTVNGPSALNGTSTVDGGLTVNGPTRVQGALVATGNLYAGSATVDGGVVVNGAARVQGAAVVTDNLYAGSIAVDGGMVTNGAARVQGAAVVTGDFYAGSATIDGGLTVRGPVTNTGETVTGTEVVTGRQYAGSLYVDGGGSFNGPINTTGATHNGPVAVAGSAVFDGGIIEQTNALAAGNACGITGRTGTLATAGATVQNAPSFCQDMNVWESGANHVYAFRTVPNGNTSNSYVSFAWYRDNAYWSAPLILKSDGTSTLTSTSVTTFSVTGQLTTKGLKSSPQALSAANDGAGTLPAIANFDATYSRTHLTCNDTDGCTLAINETSVADGQSHTICNIGTYAVTIARVAGAFEPEGQASQVLHQYDCMRMAYVTNTWVQDGQVAHNHL